jgi:hypothetical protein
MTTTHDLYCTPLLRQMTASILNTFSTTPGSGLTC